MNYQGRTNYKQIWFSEKGNCQVRWLTYERVCNYLSMYRVSGDVSSSRYLLGAIPAQTFALCSRERIDSRNGYILTWV